MSLSQLSSSFLIEVIDILNIVLHQHQVRILIWSLLGLPFLDSLVEEVYSLLIFLFELCFYTFILNILKPVHLEVIIVFARSSWRQLRSILTTVTHDRRLISEPNSTLKP